MPESSTWLNLIQHHPAEGPGAIDDWAESRGLTLRIFRADLGQLPEVSAAPVIILGGPYESNAGPQWLAQERKWLAASLASGLAFAESATTLRATEMRSEPLGSAEVVAKLAAQQSVEITARQGAWAGLKTEDGQEGWARILNLRTGSGQASAASALVTAATASASKADTIAIFHYGAALNHTHIQISPVHGIFENIVIRTQEEVVDQACLFETCNGVFFALLLYFESVVQPKHDPAGRLGDVFCIQTSFEFAVAYFGWGTVNGIRITLDSLLDNRCIVE